MNKTEIELFSHGTKFLRRQIRDIARFGRKQVWRENVSSELLSELTPHRRLSNRFCSLSDPSYFISKFEKENGLRFLPKEWSLLSEQEKVQYIVKSRYSKMVANRSMNKLHELAKSDSDLGIERLISLDKDGEIIGFAESTGNHVGTSVIPGTRTAIHNHPALWEQQELNAIGNKKVRNAHSAGDIGSSIRYNIDSYVVDEQRNKFLFQPAQIFGTRPNWSRSQYAAAAEIKVKGVVGIDDAETRIIRYNPRLEQAKTLNEFAEIKFKALSEAFDEQIGRINELEKNGVGRFIEIT